MLDLNNEIILKRCEIFLKIFFPDVENLVGIENMVGKMEKKHLKHDGETCLKTRVKYMFFKTFLKSNFVFSEYITSKTDAKGSPFQFFLIFWNIIDV